MTSKTTAKFRESTAIFLSSGSYAQSEWLLGCCVRILKMAATLESYVNRILSPFFFTLKR